MASVRDIFIRLGIKSDPKKLGQINTGLRTITSTATKAAAALLSMFAFRAVGRVITETAALGDSVDKVSSKLGIATGALQELRFAAGQTGVAQSALDVGLQRFIRRASEASQGTGVAVKALEELGVQVNDVHGNMLPVEQLLGQVADGFQRTEGDADRVRLAFKLFDTEGVNLVNTLKGGSAALDALREKARQTGGIMDRDLIKSTVEYTDAAGEFGLVMDSVRNGFAKGLFPVLVTFMKRMGEFVKTNRRLVKGLQGWLKTNREMIASGFVRFLGRLARITHSVFSFIKDVIGAIGDWTDSLGPLGKQIFSVVKTVALLAAVLLLPGGAILLLIGLIGLLIDDFQVWRAGGDSVIGDMIGWFTELLAPVEVYREAMVATFRDMVTFSEEAKLAMAGVAGAVTALAFAIGVKLVAANASAIASFISLQAFSVQYYAVLAAGAIRTAAITAVAQAKMAAGWLLAFGPIGVAVAVIGGLIGGIVFMLAELKEETGSWGKAWEQLSFTVFDFWADMFSKLGEFLLGQLVRAAMAVAKKVGGIGKVISGFFGGGDEDASAGAPGVADEAINRFVSGNGQGTPAMAMARPTAGAGSSVSNNNSTPTFNMEINAASADAKELAEILPPMIAKEQEKANRDALRSFEVATAGAA